MTSSVSLDWTDPRTDEVCEVDLQVFGSGHEVEAWIDRIRREDGSEPDAETYRLVEADRRLLDDAIDAAADNWLSGQYDAAEDRGRE